MYTRWIEIRWAVEALTGRHEGYGPQTYCEIDLDKHTPQEVTEEDVQAIVAQSLALTAAHAAKLAARDAMTAEQAQAAEREAMDTIFAHDSSDNRTVPRVRTPAEEARLDKEHALTMRIMREREEMAAMDDIFG